jgi:4-amino-4-deoxyprephenate dehydrogenase
MSHLREDFLFMSGAFRSAVVLGDGAVGGMLGRLLSDDGCQVTAFDLRGGTDAAQPPTGAYARVLRDADLVVLSLPEPACLSALRLLTVEEAPLALVVDTTSVKSALPPLWARPGCPPVLSINPMFKPGLAVEGRPCLVVDPHSSAAGSAFTACLSRWGLQVVPIPDAQTHDRLCAATQASVHAAVLAFGLALSSSGTSVAEVLAVAPPPCRTMLLLLARISGGVANVYEDIQTANPFAAAARDSLRAGLAQFDASLSSSADFSLLLDRVAHWLGASQDSLADECRRIFEELASVTDGSPVPPGNPPGRH